MRKPDKRLLFWKQKQNRATQVFIRQRKQAWTTDGIFCPPEFNKASVSQLVYVLSTVDYKVGTEYPSKAIHLSHTLYHLWLREVWKNLRVFLTQALLLSSFWSLLFPVPCLHLTRAAALHKLPASCKSKRLSLRHLTNLKVCQSLWLLCLLVSVLKQNQGITHALLSKAYRSGFCGSWKSCIISLYPVYKAKNVIINNCWFYLLFYVVFLKQGFSV